MTQLNLHVTPEFEAELAKLMKDRGLKSKSEAIRLAVHEVAAAPQGLPKKRDWSELIGLVDRYPGGRQSGKTAKELQAEIDEEMEAVLSRRSAGK